MTVKKNNRIERFILTASAAGIILLLFMLADRAEERFGINNDYIVKTKCNNTISFRGLDKNNDKLKIMRFENKRNGMKYYDNISVGDTVALSIKKDGADRVLYNNYRKGRILNISNIYSINRENLDCIIYSNEYRKR